MFSKVAKTAAKWGAIIGTAAITAATAIGGMAVNTATDIDKAMNSYITSTGIAIQSPAVNSSTSAPVVKLIGVPKLVVFSSAAETTDEQVATVAAAKHKLKTLFNFMFFYLLLLTLTYFLLGN